MAGLFGSICLSGGGLVFLSVFVCLFDLLSPSLPLFLPASSASPSSRCSECLAVNASCESPACASVRQRLARAASWPPSPSFDPSILSVRSSSELSQIEPLIAPPLLDL